MVAEEQLSLIPAEAVTPARLEWPWTNCRRTG
jgi:hypothetical protein